MNCLVVAVVAILEGHATILSSPAVLPFPSSLAAPVIVCRFSFLISTFRTLSCPRGLESPGYVDQS